MLIRNRRDRAVTVAPAGQDPFEVGAGESVDVDDALGASLLEQSDRWEAAESKTTKKSTKSEED